MSATEVRTIEDMTVEQKLDVLIEAVNEIIEVQGMILERLENLNNEPQELTIFQ